MYMAETVSVRIDKPDLKEIEALSKTENKTKSFILREVLEKGIKEKKLEIALQKFRDNNVTAWKAARVAGVPLSQFLDILVHKGIDFHYGLKELKEDFEGLI
jgi:predicted HTH domain antitoxin